MNLSVELIIWLAACAQGLATACLSLRLASLLVRAVTEDDLEVAMQDNGVHHLWRTELERVVGWSMFLLAGIVISFQPIPESPQPSSLAELLVRWLLVATVVLWSYKTASDYVFARHVWRAAQPTNV